MNDGGIEWQYVQQLEQLLQALFLDVYLEDAMAKSSGSLSFFSDFVEFFRKIPWVFLGI